MSYQTIKFLVVGCWILGTIIMYSGIGVLYLKKPSIPLSRKLFTIGALIGVAGVLIVFLASILAAVGVSWL